MDGADNRKRRPKAFQQLARDFVDGLVEYILSSNENYEYIIVATKENDNLIMELVYFSLPVKRKDVPPLFFFLVLVNSQT